MIHQARPFRLSIPFTGGAPSAYDEYSQRRLSDMRDYYHDSAAADALIDANDPLIYEVWSILTPELAGELPFGVTRLLPGTVGGEYFMTKGHYHQVLETGEVYLGLAGEGRIVTETPEGDTDVQALTPGTMLYIPPRWAHRTVNVGAGDLWFAWVYPGNAGHDYVTIVRDGFRLRLMDKNGTPGIMTTR